MDMWAPLITNISFRICGNFADKPVMGEHYRTIQINVIIHVNMGINMLTL